MNPFAATFILASASPRRRSLLHEHGYVFEVVAPEVEEIAPGHLTPREIVLRNARAKAAEVAHRRPEAVVLGVDTLVAFAGDVLGKPRDLQHAASMLARLNGRAHEVLSGVWVLHGARGLGCVERTLVHFHSRTEAQRQAYHARIQPLDKAGAYAAQDDRGEMIRETIGSFTNVIGLPMERLAKLLEEFR